MRKKYKFEQETPKLLKKMGLDELYQKHIKIFKEREKTRREIWIKNPPNYKCKAYKEILYNTTEDLFTITGEDFFAKARTYNKEDLYYENN
ncbi:MAG: hypothetical protein LBG15_07845 [Dysgonamonadaceae bacterium]|jgi:hypothetical protein|nr:hypothetical protein [Dysgonamonadaceae bacterium]